MTLTNETIMYEEYWDESEFDEWNVDDPVDEEEEHFGIPVFHQELTRHIIGDFALRIYYTEDTEAGLTRWHIGWDKASTEPLLGALASDQAWGSFPWTEVDGFNLWYIMSTKMGEKPNKDTVEEILGDMAQSHYIIMMNRFGDVPGDLYNKF